jgi:hypothetical protein
MEITKGCMDELQNVAQLDYLIFFSGAYAPKLSG